MIKGGKFLPFLFLPALLLIISCVNPASSVVPVSEISFNKNPTSLYIGETVQLAVAFTPQNATDKGLTWTSQDPGTATVDNEGNVTGIKDGYTAIIAKSDDGGVEAECGIKVCTYPVREISLDVHNLPLAVGELYQLIATVSPAYATDKSVTWVSSDDTVVLPIKDGDGKIVAIKKGTATITATTTDGGKTDQCIVTVSQ